MISPESQFVIQDGKKLKRGFTTGSCAAAASKAAVLLALEQLKNNQVTIDTPAGIELTVKVCHSQSDSPFFKCGIKKDAGDDPDVTNGLKIFAQVEKREDQNINIKAGKGIGTITKSGFWGKAGQPAINPTPLKMIRQEIKKVSNDGWNVEISAPDADKIYKKTFNEGLGIKGGISIIGTTGIVEPMSDSAWIKTIHLEIESLYQPNNPEILLYLGNHGKRLSDHLNLPSVKISNFIGESVSYSNHLGFKKIVLAGHIGKMSKLALGAFNTHNRVCDLRIEAFVFYLALAGAPLELQEEILKCTDTEAACRLVFENQYEQIFLHMARGCKTKVLKYLKSENIDIEIYIYLMDGKIIGQA